MDSKTLSPHISSIICSISLVPHSAVPAIIDCIMASTASSSDLSPSLFFSSLLLSFPSDPIQLHDLLSSRGGLLSHTSALCHLSINYQVPADALRLLIGRIFVPVLKAIDTNDLVLSNEIEGLLFEWICKMQSLELIGETLVPYCLRSIGLSVGMVRNDESDFFKWKNENFLEFPGTVPLPTARRFLTSLLDRVLIAWRENFAEEELLGFAANLVWDLSNLAVGMLMHSPECRSPSICLLLPTVFKSLSLCPLNLEVHGAPYVLSMSCFARKIWKICLHMLSQGHLDRLDAYNVLSMYFSSFYTPELNENFAWGNSCEEFDLRAEKEFWDEIRKGLVDKDAWVRKQVLHILKVSLSNYSSYVNGNDPYSIKTNSLATGLNGHAISSNGISLRANTTKKGRWAEKEAQSLGVREVCCLEDGYLSSQERWKAFLLLYEMLEEYGTHLVEAAWTHQISLLFESWSMDDHVNTVSHEAYQVQMETIEEFFSWLAILWERGFVHGNPQVRSLIMQSFLSIDWEKHIKCAQKLPRSFLLGPFILGLNDVVHHRDFGVNGIYTSRTIQDATKLFSGLSCQFSSSELVDFVLSLASIARKESFGRAGLMALCFCISSAAGTNGKQYHLNSFSEADHVESFQEVLPSRVSDLLDALAVIIERSKQHFNPNYRLQVCEQVIKAAAFVVNGYNVSLEVLLHFLSTVPREFTDNAGPLREMVQWWLTQKNDKCTRDLVLKDLVNFPASFLKHNHPPDDSISFDDEDIDAWKLEAKRWVKVFFLVAKETQCLEQIFMSLQMYCDNLCKPGSRIHWVPVKLLIIIRSVVEELQIECRKFEGCTRTKKFDRASFLVTCSSFEILVGPFVVMMEEILSFSRSVSPIFWSGSMKDDSSLPCSIKGKLGGRSLRRLAGSTTSALLEAIMSLETLACMSSWFAQLKRDDHRSRSFAFTWEFSWKVIQSHNYSSETGAELCFAGYEALTYVFKAWTTTFTSSVFDFIVSYNKSHFPDKENLPLLDPLVHSLLQNINALLANGLLTRSRRAVLMNWKWHCVDSLLSIPYNVIQSGVHKSNAQLFFSDSILRSTFADIVESLENAGENSVLYILRSVRCVIAHLCFIDTSSAISSFAGVDCKMMQQLVHSSWILHLSCNKRRVASIAALLSTVLHQLVFSDLRMHETSDSQQGPLKWFIGKLLDEGVKSPRTIRLATLHLTGLWLLYPKTLVYYIKELKLLSLYGSVAFDEDFEAELCENHESRTEVLLLAQSPEHELTQAFINTELYARVSVAVLFYKLAALANTQKKQEDEDSLAALHCGKIFLLELLDSAVNDEGLSKELYKKFSAVHRRKVRVWQMICVLSNFVEDDIVEDVMLKLHVCVYRSNLPSVRQYLEIFAVHVYLKFPILAERQLIPMFYDYNMRPQALSSYVFIATNVILHASEPALQIMHLHKLLPPIIPFLTSHHHSLRAFTQLLVHYVLCKMWPASEPNTSKAVPLEKKCFEDLKSYLSENVDCMRLRKSMEGFLDAFDPNTSVSPSGIFSARDEGFDFECAPVSLMEHVTTFLNDVREDLRNSIAKDCVTIEHESLNPHACQNTVESDLSLDFQKKITLHENARQVSNSATYSFLSELEMEDQLLNAAIQSRNQAMAKIKEGRQQFILVASLLDRIPNLAGLARTCEIFQAAGLVVANASILQDKQFQLISVTADKWVPIIEVPVSSMKVYLEKKRQEGFSILGLEQTANSTPLDKYIFPSKTVLVLGREKEGIPVDIIHILDACVEIPQLGIIRSLNVHVSGAIALWEYTRQQRSK